MVDLKFVMDKNPNCFKSREHLAKFLHDIYPYSKREVNVAMIVYDSGIASRISLMNEINGDQTENFKKQLFDEFGLYEQFAADGIVMWAKAYNVPVKQEKVIDLTKQTEAKAEEPIKNEEPVKIEEPVYVQQNIPGPQPTAPKPAEQKPVIPTAVHSVAIRPFNIPPSFVRSNVPHAAVPGEIGNRSFVNQTKVFKGRFVFDNKEMLFEYTAKDDGFYITKATGSSFRRLVIPGTLNGMPIIGIEKNTFSGMLDIQSLTICEGIKYIEDGAFYDCSALKEVILPTSLEEIGSSKDQDRAPEHRSGAFEKCTSLSEINIPDNVIAINESAFTACENLKKVKLSENLRYIRDFAFYGCRKLSSVYFGSSLVRIGYWAFYWCQSIKTVVLNEGLRRIGEEAFGYCSGITQFVLPSTVSQIDRNIFGGSVNKKLTIYCTDETFAHDYAVNKGYKIDSINNFKDKTGGIYQ